MCEANVEVNAADLNLSRRVRESQIQRVMHSRLLIVKDRFYKIDQEINSSTPYWRRNITPFKTNKQLTESQHTITHQ